MNEPAIMTAGDGELAPESVAARAARDRFAGLEVPEALHASMARHRANLARLVQGLRVAGVDEAQIEASLSVLLDSYKTELLEACKNIMEQHFE